ncbi:MAG: hypothetical protein ABSE73_16580 [Planctomycetota bacterium]
MQPRKRKPKITARQRRLVGQLLTDLAEKKQVDDLTRIIVAGTLLRPLRNIVAQFPYVTGAELLQAVESMVKEPA